MVGNKIYEQQYNNKGILYHISTNKLDKFTDKPRGGAHHMVGGNIVFFSKSKDMCIDFARSVYCGEDFEWDDEYFDPDECFYLHYCRPTKSLNILNPSSKKDYAFMEEHSIYDWIKDNLEKISKNHNWFDMERFVEVVDITKFGYDGFVTAQYEYSNIAVYDPHKNIKILKVEEIPLKSLVDLNYKDETDESTFSTIKENKMIKSFDEILQEGMFGDIAAQAAQRLPFEKTQNFARSHWRKNYPDEFAEFEAKEAEAEAERKRIEQEEWEAANPWVAEERAKEAAVSDMLERANGFKGLKKPNDWKAYLDQQAANDSELMKYFKGPISMKRGVVSIMHKRGQISTEIYKTCMKKISDKQPIGPKGAKEKPAPIPEEDQLFESIWLSNHS